MSNPFATFRKNQKYWMAGLVLLSILAFVVYPVFDYARQAMQSGGLEKQTIVRWQGGRITVVDAQNWSRKHAALVRFLVAVAREVIEKGGQPRVPGFYVDPNTKQIEGIGISMQSDLESICRTRIFAEYGKRLGIALDDDAIDSFLRDYCDGRIDSARIEQILLDATDGTLDWFEIREMLKTELTAVLVNQLLLSPLSADPPGVTFSDFLKLNRTAKVEAFPVLVDDFLDQVTGSPTEEELRSIYEAGKNRVANPNSPEPGFALPYRTNLQYIEADPAAFVEREKKKLTEEQLRAEYESRVKLGQLQVPVEPPESADDSAAAPQSPETSEAAPAASAAAPSTMPPSATPPATDAPEVPEIPPAPEPSSPEASNPPANSEVNAAPEAEANPADAGQPADSPTAESPQAPAETDQGFLQPPGRAAVRLVAAIQASPAPAAQSTQPNLPPPVVAPPRLGEAPEEEASQQADTDPQSSASSLPDSAAGTSGDQDDPASSDAASSTPAPTEQPPAPTPPQVPSTPADALTNSTGNGTVDTAEPGQQGETDSQPQMRTLSFEEARDQIADDLARAAASTALNEALRALRDEVMLPYYQAYRQYSALKNSADELGGDVDAQPPPAPDLAAEAAKYGLIVQETGLVDANQLAATTIGRSEVSLPELGIQRETVARLASGPTLELFYPVQSMFIDFSGLSQGQSLTIKQFLFWKTDEQQPRVPSYDEVVDAVVDAWKRQRARQLAEARANEIAKKVAVGGEDPWAAALPEEARGLVVTTSPFSWMSRFGEFIAVSDVPELNNVGEEFMERVFTAKEGATVVAPNANHDVFYVARVVAFAPPEEELLTRFQADSVKAGPRQIAQNRTNMAVMDIYNTVMQEMGVEWEVDPSQFN